MIVTHKKLSVCQNNHDRLAGALGGGQSARVFTEPRYDILNVINLFTGISSFVVCDFCDFLTMCPHQSRPIHTRRRRQGLEDDISLVFCRKYGE